MPHAFAKTLKTFKTKSGKEGTFFSLPALAKQYPGVERLPVSIRIAWMTAVRSRKFSVSPARATRAGSSRKMKTGMKMAKRPYQSRQTSQYCTGVTTKKIQSRAR